MFEDLQLVDIFTILASVLLLENNDGVRSLWKRIHNSSEGIHPRVVFSCIMFVGGNNLHQYR